MPQALLIIDMQQGSFTPETPRHDAKDLVGRLNKLAEKVRQNSGLVIFIQHDGPEGNPHHPDAPGWHLLPDLIVRPEDKKVRKKSCDSFVETNLANILENHAISDLIITGCATDYCVDSTVRGALGRGYHVIAPSDGHTTADRPHLKATNIIYHHNTIWRDMSSPTGPAQVYPIENIVFGTDKN